MKSINKWREKHNKKRIHKKVLITEWQGMERMREGIGKENCKRRLIENECRKMERKNGGAGGECLEIENEKRRVLEGVRGRKEGRRWRGSSSKGSFGDWTCRCRVTEGGCWGETNKQKNE